MKVNSQNRNVIRTLDVRTIIVMLIVVLIVNACLIQFTNNNSVYAAGKAKEVQPTIAAESAILIEADTGKIIYEKAADKQQFPASITKIMTALLVLEKMELNKKVKIGANVPKTEGKSGHFKENEQVTIDQLVHAMLMESDNDATIALAEEVSGDIDSFAKLMNKRAKKIGTKSTHFANPNGLSNPNHYTSANDMALIAREAMKNSEFRKIVSTKKFVIPATNMTDSPREIYNSNKLLMSNSFATVDGKERSLEYDGTIGIKTGYTEASRATLVAEVSRGGHELIGVIMRTERQTQYPDMISLLDYGFRQYKDVDILTSSDVVKSVKVEDYLWKCDLTVDKPVSVLVAKSSNKNKEDLLNDYSLDIKINKLKAPISEGQQVGQLIVKRGDVYIGKYDLINKNEIKGSIFAKVIDILKTPVIFGIPIFILIILLLIIVIVVHRRRRINRKK